MTSEQRAQKFYTDDLSLSKSGLCFLLVEVSFFRGITNQKHFPDAVFTRHQSGISVLVPQKSFAGKPVVAPRNAGCFAQDMIGPAVDKS